MGSKQLKAEWGIAENILGEIGTNDFSKPSYEKWSVTDMMWSTKNKKSRISWETWKRYYTENLKDALSRLKTSTEYKDFDGNIQKINNFDEESLVEEGEAEVEDFLKVRYSSKGELIVEGVDIEKVAYHLIETHNIKTWFGKRFDYSHTFDGRIFNNDTRAIIKVEVEKLLGVYCKKNIVEEIFEKVKRKTKVNREDFEKDDRNFLNLENGVWDLKEKRLLPHDPKYNFQTYIPQTYNENAKCKIWMKFISETLYPEDIPVIQEWFGFMMYREYFLKKMLICEGPTDTGKSVLMDTGIKFIGENNKTGISLQKISSGSDFTKLSLKNKLLNAYDDLSSKDLNDGGAIKVATGGGYISGEEKFGEYQQFRSYAKQWYNANKCPPIKDNDDLAYFGRNMMMKCDNVPEKLDPFLRKKLWTNEEMSGILNWALEGLYRLLENGKFSYNKTPEEVKQLMESSSCPLVAFSSDVLEKEDGYVISKDDMFKVYSEWCEKNNKPRLSKEMLGRNFTKYCPYIIAAKQKKNIWKNARFRGNWGDFIKKDTDSDTFDTSKKVISDYTDNDSQIDNINKNKVSKVSGISSEEYKQAGFETKEDYDRFMEETQ